MQSLQVYIDKLKNIRLERSYQIDLNKFDLYDLQILDSCFEFYKNSIDTNYGFYQIFESHSIFNKCRDITKFITFIINNFDVKNSSILFMCDNIEELINDYVSNIYVNVDDHIKNNAEYELSNEVNFVNEKFDYIVINIKSNLSKDQIYDKIEHELTHFYEDYKRKLNNSESLYDKSIRTKYNKLSINDKDSKEIKDIKNLLYLLDKSEQNAYLAQFDGILGDNKYLTIQQAYEKIYNSKLYKDIKELLYLVTNKYKEIQYIICKSYKEIYNNNKSDKKILKTIYNEWERFNEHFRRNIYQCICDHIIDNTNNMDHNNIFLGNDNKKTDEELLNKIRNNYINKYIFIEK